MTLSDKVYQLTSRIPKGKVTTYGAIARSLGVGSARPIGNILHVNPMAPTVPCHRVVNSTGQLAKNFGAAGKMATHAKRLRAEGVTVINNQVDLKKYLWTP
jgi:O-6-methylguanine DNA methyltransferase